MEFNALHKVGLQYFLCLVNEKKVWILTMLIDNPHLIDQKDEASRLQGSHPNGVTQVYSIGRGRRSDSVKHVVQINM